MYLVINLTVADMFVGGMGTFDIVFHSLLYGCEVGNELFPNGSIIANQEWEPFIVLAMISMWLPLTSVAGIAESSYFFISYACAVWPFRHRKIKRWAYGVTIAGAWI